MTGKWRQALHLEPPRGWLNDPNGLCFFKGKYHVYFQYCPDSALGKADKCWGHYESADMIKWTFTGTVLFPDSPDDRSGVYSGSAIEKDGVLHIFYTGNVKEEGDYDYINVGRRANVIHVTTHDAVTMSAKRTVLTNADYPDFCSCHVRDPKVWKDGDEYFMMLGARTKDSRGCALFYRSVDLETWEYVGNTSIDDFGYMWECPDYFKIDGERYLSVSPQGLPHGSEKFQNVYASGYFRANGYLGDFTEWDMGFDFYAPQTFEAPDGRRILIGWNGICDADYTNPTVELGYQHCLTLPRVVTKDADGALRQTPAEELTALRRSKGVITNGNAVLLETPFELLSTPAGDFSVTIDNALVIEYGDGRISMKFTDKSFGGGRTIRRAEINECGDFRLIVDRSGLELYLNGGRTVMSSRIFPTDRSVSVDVRGTNAEFWTLCPTETIIDGE